MLTALSVAISTRVPMVVNMVTCFHDLCGRPPDIAPGRAERVADWKWCSSWRRLIATALPNLEHFNTQAAVATGTLVPPAYLGFAALYCAAFSLAAILLAFILFEDRDLA